MVEDHRASTETEQLRSELHDKVTDLEGMFLSTERALRDGRPTVEAMHLLLRHAHSLKGALGVAEKTSASGCVHAMETAFVALRDGRLEASQALFDLAFATIDLLTRLVDQNKDEAPLFDDLAKKWTLLADRSQNLAGHGLMGIPFSLTAEEARALGASVAHKHRLYLIEKSIYGDMSRTDYDGLPILQDIARLGVLVARHPRFEDLDRKAHEAVLLLLVATALDADALKNEIFDPLQTVSLSDKDHSAYLSEPKPAASDPAPRRLRSLIVEDDFTSRLMLQKFLAPFGDSHIAVDGEEALAAVESALAGQEPYDLICLDIMMPKLDGQMVLQRLRLAEETHGLSMGKGAKVVMTTCLKDSQNIMHAFKEQCDAYLVKPIARAKLIDQLAKLGLVAA
jgi:two-component system, chemotaxis family, chemotaxis protein CheY